MVVIKHLLQIGQTLRPCGHTAGPTWLAAAGGPRAPCAEIPPRVVCVGQHRALGVMLLQVHITSADMQCAVLSISSRKVSYNENGPKNPMSCQKKKERKEKKDVTFFVFSTQINILPFLAKSPCKFYRAKSEFKVTSKIHRWQLTK